jgi:hypothetical protein
MKITQVFYPLLFLGILFSSCNQNDGDDIIIEDEDEVEAPVNSDYFDNDISSAMEANKADHEESEDNSYDTNDATIIQLNGSSISVSGTVANVTVSGTLATITNSGTYIVQGTLNDGQIAVDTESEEAVKIILNDVTASNSSNAPFNVISAEKVIVFLLDGTSNTFTDTENYVFEDDDDEPNATFFSKSDLSIYGNGKLTINGNYNDALTSKDGLVIGGGEFIINSVDDGIRGKDYLVINGGDFKLNTDGDAFKSDNDDDEDRGYILINDGVFDVTTTGGDGFSAETDLMVVAGTFELNTGGGSSNYNEDVSAKALKAVLNNLIEGGTFNINSADDAVHCDGNIAIHNGTFEIASGDDAIHADEQLTINDGKISITESYEGLESNVITINGGEIRLVSSDDGINAAGGADSSGTRPGQSNGFSSSSNSYIYFQGGYIVVEAGGDGIDANGSISMTAGTVIVNDPASGGNGILDFDGSFHISGGTLIGAGTSNMAQTPSSDSDQNSMIVYLSQQTANTLFAMEDSEGNNVLTFSPSIRYAAVVYSSPALEDGKKFNIYTGGSASGTESDGLYSSPTYTQGTLVGSFTVTSNITTIR